MLRRYLRRLFFTLVGLNIAYVVWVVVHRQIHAELFWPEVYERAHDIGQNCDMGSTTLSSEDPDALVQSVNVWMHVKQPYGDQPIDKFTPGTKVLTKCILDLSAFKNAPYLVLRPHKTYSAGRFFLNRKHVATLPKTGYLDFPIPDAERSERTEFLLVSDATETHRYPGMSTYSKVVAIDNPDVLTELHGLRFYSQTEGPMARTAYLLAILLFLCASWIAGYRYLDIAIFIVLLMVATWSELALYAPSMSVNDPSYGLKGLLVAYVVLLSFVFSVAFTRNKQLLKTLTPVALFFSALIAYLYYFPYRTFASIVTEKDLLNAIKIILFILSAFVLFREAKQLPPNRSFRLKALAACNVVLAVVMFTIMCLSLSYRLDATNFVACCIATVLASITVTDQIFFQKKYLTERLQRMRLEEQSSRNVAIVESVSMIAHDFKRPIYNMTCFLHEWHEAGDNNQRQEAVAKLVPLLEVSTRQATSLASDILKVAKDEQYDLKPTSLNKVIEELIKLPFPSPQMKTLHVKFALNHQHKMVVDAEKSQRVFANIIENAAYLMPDGESITVSSIEKQNEIVISIMNTGTLISASYVGKIFDPFFSKRRGGSGLGLAIAQKDVSKMGGTISCSSNDAWETTFSLTFPLSPERDNHKPDFPTHLNIHAEDNPSVENQKPRNKNSPKVILIEDDPFMADLISKKLSQHNPVVIYSIEEFWSYLNDVPDLLASTEVVISDHYLNPRDQETGLSLLTKIAPKTLAKLFLVSDADVTVPVDMQTRIKFFGKSTFVEFECDKILQ